MGVNQVRNDPTFVKQPPHASPSTGRWHAGLQLRARQLLRADAGAVLLHVPECRTATRLLGGQP